MAEVFKYKAKTKSWHLKGYTIQPFDEKLIVFDDKKPYGFFVDTKDAKKYIREQIKATSSLNKMMNSLKITMDAMSIISKKAEKYFESHSINEQ